MDNVIGANLLLVCSICLDSIGDHKERSVAKLTCGHEFHLDCIGSAFNIKGAMVCPNCRKTEAGSWLYTNGLAPSLSNPRINDWISFAEHTYDYLVAEDPVELPLSGLTGGHSSFEQVESSATSNRESPPITSAISDTSANVDDPFSNHRRNVENAPYRITRVDVAAISRSGPPVFPSIYSHTGRSTFVSSLNRPQRNPTSHMISSIMPGVRSFSSPMELPSLVPALDSTAPPPQGGSDVFQGGYVFPHVGGQNLDEEH